MDETVVLRLELRDFRNFKTVELRPSPDGLTVVQGDNGAGKSSLLEAIVYASTLQSFRGAPREAIVRQGADGANINCDVLAGTRNVEIAIEIVPGHRDRAWHNTQRVPGVRGLLEVLRTTLFTPDDLVLVKGPPSGRRDFIDQVLLSANPRLGSDRAGLDRVLRHRNALVTPARRPPGLRGRCHARRLGRPDGPARGAPSRLPGGADSVPRPLRRGSLLDSRRGGRTLRDALRPLLGRVLERSAARWHGAKTCAGRRRPSAHNATSSSFSPVASTPARGFHRGASGAWPSRCGSQVTTS